MCLEQSNYLNNLGEKYKASQPMYAMRELIEFFTPRELLPMFEAKLEEALIEKEQIIKELREKLIGAADINNLEDKAFYKDLLRSIWQKKWKDINNEVTHWEGLIKMAKGAIENTSAETQVMREKTIRQAKQVPIEALPYFSKLTKTPKGYVTNCPLHQDNHPSFYIYTDTNSFYCFGCNQGGDVIKLVMLIEQLPFQEAVRYLVGINR